MIAWWHGSHGDLESVKDLVVRNFRADDIFAAWTKLREACQQAVGEPVQAPTRHRTEGKLAEELVKEVFECEKNGKVTLLVASPDLGIVRARMESVQGDSRPVGARLESLEDMMKSVVDKLSRIESTQEKMAKAPRPVAPPLVGQQADGPVEHVHLGGGHQKATPVQHVQGEGQQQSYAAAVTTGLSSSYNSFQHLLGSRAFRRNSLSVKRSVSGAARDQDGNNLTDEVFKEVNRKKKKKEISTGTATLQSIPGVQVPLQPSYQHFVGNTPGSMDRNTLELVFKELAVNIMQEKGMEGALEIEDCNLLTKEQNTRTRVWRVVVPHKYKEVLQDDRLYPTGWHHREFEGHYRPPLSPQERAEKDAKRAARQQNDSRLSDLLRQLAGQGHTQQV